MPPAWMTASTRWNAGGSSTSCFAASRSTRTRPETLLAAAEDRADGAVQILGFTRAVKDNYSYEERLALVEMLWEVVLADGRVDAHEAQLMRRIGGLIYVSDRDGAIARRRARRGAIAGRDGPG